MITVDDLRKPANVSGFAQVGLVDGPSRTSPPYYQAYEKGGRKGHWKGPARATALEAAQDYCDRANGGQLAPAAQRLKSAGHNGVRAQVEIPSDIEAAYGMIKDYRAQQAGKQGYVYLIVEGRGPEDVLVYGKIGFSTNPQARVRELQTGNPRPLRLYYSRPGTLEDERAIHNRHIDKNVLQEWFLIDKELLLEWDADHRVKEAA